MGSRNSIEIGKYYDRINRAGYDDIYGSLVCQAEDEILLSIISPFLFANAHVLDAGCGTGFLASNIGNDINYQGIDVSAGELTTAISKNPNYKCGFSLADIHNIPFANESFDLVLSTYGPMSYSLNPEALKEELSRVLKPGGVLIVMPYTKRTGLKMGLGGFSTAVETSIEKIFYTEDLVKETFKDFCDVRVIGINYLANFIFEKLENDNLHSLISEHSLGVELNNLPKLLAEAIHLNGNTPQLNTLSDLWERFSNDKESVELMKQILEEEIKTLGLAIPAHFARHMAVVGRKNEE